MRAAVRALRVAGFVSGRTILRGNRGVAVLLTALMAAIFAEILFIPALIQGATDHIETVLRENVTGDVTVSPGEDAQAITDPDALVAAARGSPGSPPRPPRGSPGPRSAPGTGAARGPSSPSTRSRTRRRSPRPTR